MKAGHEVKDKSLRALANAAVDSGWRYERGGNHNSVRSPDGRTIVLIARNSGCPRSVSNTRSRLRAAGVKV